MNIYIHIILVLKEYLVHLCGVHYPVEIIGLIIRRHYYRPKVSCGSNHTTVFHRRGLYVCGENVKYGRIDGKKCLHFKDETFPLVLSHIDIIGFGMYDPIDPTKYTLIPDLQKCMKMHAFSYIFRSLLGLKPKSFPYEIWKSPLENTHKCVYFRGAEWREDKLCDSKARLIPRYFLPQIKSISCGYFHTCMILNNDDIYMWGSNSDGRLGLGHYNDSNQPQKLNLLNVLSVSCGGYHTMALTLDNVLYVWGQNSDGQLGLGDNVDRIVPTKLILSRVLTISCGGFHTMVLTSENILFIWGLNNFGQLGLGDTIDHNEPQKLILSNIISINCGSHHSIVLTSDGEIYSWGCNKYGQLGLGNNINQLIPQKISLSRVMSISCGHNHVVAITSYNEIYVWGYNYYRQLGLDDNKNRNEPCRLQWIAE